jgi:uncharacterized protein (DUF1330 family)
MVSQVSWNGCVVVTSACLQSLSKRRLRAILARYLQQDESLMTKAYWITCYRKISDPAKLAAYAKLAGPAIEAGGGRFLVRGTATKAYEAGRAERTVVIEFDSVERAVAVHDSPGYQAALAALEGGAERDVRIVPGI